MRGIYSTYTYATLAVSETTYNEIARALLIAEYHHAFADDGTIDMHGIALLKPTEISMSNPNHPPHPNQGVMTDLSDDPRFVDSASDGRVANNVMRHEYRTLSDPEKIRMKQIKDKGLELWNLLDSIGQSRELSLAKTASEEAVMWGVKHITK